METTNNLPSLFRSLRTSCHSPLISTAELERLILHDKALENDTKGYREAINIDRNEARNKKRRLPAICPSIQFRRTGRKLEDFGCATGWLMLDYDHVAEIVLDEKVELASKSPYSMVVYRTISGKGLRILLRYERPKGCTLTVTELHHLAVDKAISIYDDLLHISADQQCKDMVRLCGLAHDAKAYFCWDSKPLTFTPDEVSWFYQHVVLKEQEKEEAADKAVRKNAEKNRAKSNATKGGTPPSKPSYSGWKTMPKTGGCSFSPAATTNTACGLQDSATATVPTRNSCSTGCCNSMAASTTASRAS